MRSESTESTFDALKKMLSHCQSIKELLKNDKSLFIKNDFPSLNQSNQKKSELIEQLNHLALSFNQHFLPSYKMNAANFSHGEEFELIINELKTEITHCYSYIMINSNIVFANMQQLKAIWDKLMVCKSELDTVYDKSGTPAK